MSRPGSPAGAGALVGRAAELAAVRSFLDGAGNHGGTLLLSGEPGIGKSALLDAAARLARAAGTAAVRVSGVQSEADLDLSVLNQLLVPLAGEDRRLDEAHRRALSVLVGLGRGSPPTRAALAGATLAVLRSAAADRALLVVLDDVQWVDPTSAAVLGMVARRLAGSRVGLLVAGRSTDDGFFDRAGLARRDVPPLDDRAAAQLVSARFPAVDPRVLRRLVAEAQGNPLALLELAGHLSPAQLSAAHALPPVLPLGNRLRASFAVRISGLSPGARRLLLLAALDVTGDLDLLMTAARSGPDAAGRADLALARDRQLVDVDETRHRLALRHPLLRSALIEASTGAQRQQAHLALAEALRAHAERRAWHLADAAADPDETVAAALELAARRAGDRGDPNAAVIALRQAARVSPDARHRGRRLAEAAYLGAGMAGELRSAAQLLAEARRADPGGGDPLHAAVAAALLLVNGDGNIETAGRLLAAAIDGHGQRSDGADGELTDALFQLFECCRYAGRAECWEPFHALLARLGSAVAPILRLLVATAADPVGAVRPALSDLDAAVAGLAGHADPLHVGRVALAAFSVDRLESCRDAVWRVVGNARDGGTGAAALPVLTHLSADDLLTGRWAEAAELAQEGLDISDRLGYRSARWPFRVVQAALAAVGGEPGVAHDITDEVIGWATPRGAHSLLLFCHWVRSLAALGDGDFETAYYEASAITAAGRSPATVRHGTWVMMDLIEAARRTGRDAEATAHAAAVQRAGVAARSPRLELLATAAAAFASADGAAGDLFVRALTVAGADRWPFDLARVQLGYGEQLRRARATSAARLHLGAARDSFESLGARPWAARAAAELRAAGGGARTDGAGTGARTGLTPQESQVAALAAAGFTNQQIAHRLLISRRTVDVHLYRAFPKLGINTRAALRDALDARQPRLATS